MCVDLDMHGELTFVGKHVKRRNNSKRLVDGFESLLGKKFKLN